MYRNSTSLIGKLSCMEKTHKSQKGWNTSQIYQGPKKLTKSWVSCQGDGKNMIILENGGNFMKDELETKPPPSFLVWLALPYP